ncbi:MAG: ribulose-phosphate 3-epimerase [Actinomycetota bacterium]|nr:ribulose-phosphate 3-epimerase [Actinomycetota bacterium]
MESDVLISPSVLDADLSRLRAEVDSIAAVADMIHLDVMDNHFVPNLTFGLPVIESLLKSSDIRADCHLMIDDPDRWAPPYAQAGAYSVTFHVEAARDPARVCADIRQAGARAGVAVKPGTDLTHIDALGDSMDMILVMTVEPGFGGQSFMTDMLEKVTRARLLADRADGDVWVQVDGGVGADTIGLCAEAGANVFVAGSAVFRADDPAAMVETLRSLAAEASR